MLLINRQAMRESHLNLGFLCKYYQEAELKER